MTLELVVSLELSSVFFLILPSVLGVEQLMWVYLGTSAVGQLMKRRNDSTKDLTF